MGVRSRPYLCHIKLLTSPHRTHQLTIFCSTSIVSLVSGWKGVRGSEIPILNHVRWEMYFEICWNALETDSFQTFQKTVLSQCKCEMSALPYEEEKQRSRVFFKHWSDLMVAQDSQHVDDERSWGLSLKLSFNCIGMQMLASKRCLGGHVATVWTHLVPPFVPTAKSSLIILWLKSSRIAVLCQLSVQFRRVKNLFGHLDLYLQLRPSS